MLIKICNIKCTHPNFEDPLKLSQGHTKTKPDVTP